jgi:hypothetical protein
MSASLLMRLKNLIQLRAFTFLFFGIIVRFLAQTGDRLYCYAASWYET